MRYIILSSIILLYGLSELGCKPKESKSPMSRLDSLSHILSGDSFQYWIEYPLLKKSIDFQMVDSQMYVLMFRLKKNGILSVHHYFPRTEVANPIDFSYSGQAWELESEHLLNFFLRGQIYDIFEFKKDTLKMFELCSNDSFLLVMVESPVFYKGWRRDSEYSNNKVIERITHEWIRKELK